MEFLSRWREPRELAAQRFTDKQWRVVPPFPPVIIVTDRGLAAWHGHGLDEVTSNGYIFLRREPHIGGGVARFIRGRWLWCLHKAGGWLYGRTRWLAWLGRKEYEAPRW